MSDFLTGPFRLVGALFEFAFVFAILEFLGILFYSAVTAEAQAQALMQSGPTPVEFAAFALASPDRIAVAAVLAVVAFVSVFVLKSSGGTGGGGAV